MEGETVHMKLEGKMAELLTNLDPKLYRKYATNEKGRTVLHVELKISIWNSPGRTAFLKINQVNYTGVGVRDKSLQLVRGKQDRQRKTNDSRISCGRPEDLPREWRHSGLPDQKNHREIQKIGRPKNPPRKGAQVSGDEA